MSRLCKDIHVPVPTGAYWAKLKAGKPVDAPAPLPPVQIAESGKIVDGLIAPRPIMGKSSGESLQMNDSQSVQHTEAEKSGRRGPVLGSRRTNWLSQGVIFLQPITKTM
jgi:hypothetical protein